MIVKYIYIYIYYLDQKFPEFIQKIQNTSFIHQKWYYPLQSTPPSTATYLCQHLIQLSKHFWNSIVGIAITAVFDFTSFRLLKRVPRNGFLTRSNRKKSQGVILGEFDGCWMVRFVLGQKFMDNDGTVCYHGAKSTSCKKSKIRAEVDVLKMA